MALRDIQQQCKENLKMILNHLFQLNKNKIFTMGCLHHTQIYACRLLFYFKVICKSLYDISFVCILRFNYIIKYIFFGCFVKKQSLLKLN